MDYSIVVAKVYYSEEKGIYIYICVFLLIGLAAILLNDMKQNQSSNLNTLCISYFTVVLVIMRGFSVALLE